MHGPAGLLGDDLLSGVQHISVLCGLCCRGGDMLYLYVVNCCGCRWTM